MINGINGSLMKYLSPFETSQRKEKMKMRQKLARGRAGRGVLGVRLGPWSVELPQKGHLSDAVSQALGPGLLNTGVKGSVVARL